MSPDADNSSMRLRAAARWIAFALLGIVIAGGVSIAASRLTSQNIGLASQPISAGRALAPPAQGSSANPSKPAGLDGHGSAGSATGQDGAQVGPTTTGQTSPPADGNDTENPVESGGETEGADD